MTIFVLPKPVSPIRHDVSPPPSFANNSPAKKLFSPDRRHRCASEALLDSEILNAPPRKRRVCQFGPEDPYQDYGKRLESLVRMSWQSEGEVGQTDVEQAMVTQFDIYRRHVQNRFTLMPRIYREYAHAIGMIRNYAKEAPDWVKQFHSKLHAPDSPTHYVTAVVRRVQGSHSDSHRLLPMESTAHLCKTVYLRLMARLGIRLSDQPVDGNTYHPHPDLRLPSPESWGVAPVQSPTNPGKEFNLEQALRRKREEILQQKEQLNTLLSRTDPDKRAKLELAFETIKEENKAAILRENDSVVRQSQATQLPLLWTRLRRSISLEALRPLLEGALSTIQEQKEALSLFTSQVMHECVLAISDLFVVHQKRGRAEAENQLTLVNASTERDRWTKMNAIRRLFFGLQDAHTFIAPVLFTWSPQSLFETLFSNEYPFDSQKTRELHREVIDKARTICATMGEDRSYQATFQEELESLRNRIESLEYSTDVKKKLFFFESVLLANAITLEWASATVHIAGFLNQVCDSVSEALLGDYREQLLAILKDMIEMEIDGTLNEQIAFSLFLPYYTRTFEKILKEIDKWNQPEIAPMKKWNIIYGLFLHYHSGIRHALLENGQTKLVANFDARMAEKLAMVTSSGGVLLL